MRLSRLAFLYTYLLPRQIHTGQGIVRGDSTNTLYLVTYCIYAMDTDDLKYVLLHWQRRHLDTGRNISLCLFTWRVIISRGCRSFVILING